MATTDKDNVTDNRTQINKVFVYGTLMQNFSNYKRYLKGRINRVMSGTTSGLLYHLPEGYPALIAGNQPIKGEIIEPVDEKLLQILDRLEDYAEGRNSNLYVREVRNILTEDGEEVACWVYIYANERYAQENGILVPDGDWRKFMEKRGKFAT